MKLGNFVLKRKHIIIWIVISTKNETAFSPLLACPPHLINA